LANNEGITGEMCYGENPDNPGSGWLYLCFLGNRSVNDAPEPAVWLKTPLYSANVN
jgi:hypothetical protein